MKPRHSAELTTAPPGVAAIWALVVLSVLGVLLASIASEWLLNRRLIGQRENSFQAHWLARAGVELAASRLLADPVGYRGESVAFIPESQVRVVVEVQAGEPNTFLVKSEARYPTDEAHPVVRSITGRFQRLVDKEGIRLGRVAPKTAPPEGDSHS